MIPTQRRSEDEPTEQEREQEVREAAQRLFERNPHWVTFFREILGANGIVRRLYPTVEALASFERTEAYHAIQQMLVELRQKSAEVPRQEPTKVITVRLPRSLHEALRREAHDHQTSLNQLCIAKLMQIIDSGLVPSDLRRSLETGEEYAEEESGERYAAEPAQESQTATGVDL